MIFPPVIPNAVLAQPVMKKTIKINKILFIYCSFLFSVLFYSTVADLNKTGNYKSFQNLELRPFALKNFIIVNGIFLPAHNKEINTIIPIGPEPKRVSTSA